MRKNLEPLKYSTLAASRYTVYLHPSEYTRLEGIVPALETAHALHYVMHRPSDSQLDLVCLSGRGDKDLAEVLAMDE